MSSTTSQADGLDLALAAVSLILSVIIERSQLVQTGIEQFDHHFPLLIGVAAIVCFGIAVPRTHLRSFGKQKFWQPFEGGTRFITLQSLSWTFFGIALLTASLSLLSRAFGFSYFKFSTLSEIWVLAGILGFLSEIFMVLSIPNYSVGKSSDPSGKGWNHISVLALLLTAFALMGSVALELGIPIGGVESSILKALVIVFITGAVALTHLLIGRLYHDAHWKFYQPWTGGWRFIAMQILSWTSFGFALLTASICTLLTLISPGLMLQGGWATVGILGFISEIFMIASIPNYSIAEEGNPLVQAKMTLIQLRVLAVTLFMFNLYYIGPVVMFSPLFFFPYGSGLLVLLLIGPLYLAFHRWSEQRAESLYSSKFRSSFFLADLQRYFGGRVIAMERLDDSQQYIFGFHPHGTLTATAMWCHNAPEWKENVLANDLVTLVGSQLLCLPVMRELILACGGRAVSKHTFAKVLAAQKSVLLIPGGLAEMKYSNSKDKEITVITKHKGFIRFAIQYGVPLVPVFSFGETQVMDPCLPTVQKLCLKYLGVPFPIWCGRFVMVPRSCGVTVVVGKPIYVQKNENPSEEEINKIHKEYFEALYSLFEGYKDQCGHEDYALRLLDFPHELTAPKLADRKSVV